MIGFCLMLHLAPEFSLNKSSKIIFSLHMVAAKMHIVSLIYANVQGVSFYRFFLKHDCKKKFCFDGCRNLRRGEEEFRKNLCLIFNGSLIANVVAISFRIRLLLNYAN